MAKSLLPALPGGRITNRAGRDRPRFIRPVERQRMRPWLEEHLDKNDIPGLLWVDKKERIFKIAWKHAANQCFNLQKDTNLFERWAIHTGRHYDSDHKRWKANFRCALNSLPDVKENKEQGVKKGNNAFKVYRFLDEKETRGLKETKVRKKPTFRTETALTVHGDDDEYIPKGLVSLKVERPDPSTPSIPNLEQLYPTSGVEMLIQAGTKQKVETLTDTADDTNLQEILAAATASLAAGSDPATLENISINQLKRLGEVSRMKLDVRQGVKKNSPGYMYVFLCRWCEKVFSRKIELFQHFLVTHQDRLMAGEEYGEQALEENNSDTKHQKLLEEIQDLEQKVLGFSEKSYQSSEAGSEEYLDDQIAANEVIGEESGAEEKALDLTVQNKSPKASARQDVALDLSMSTGKKAKHSKQGQGKQIVKRRRSSQESDLNYSVKFGNYGIVGTPRTKRQMSLHTRKKEEEQERLAKKLTTTDGQDASRQHSIEDIVHAEMLLSLKTGNEDGNENSSGSGSSKKDTNRKGKKGKMAAKKTGKGDKSKTDDKSMIHGPSVKLATDIEVAEEVVEDTDDDDSGKQSSVKAYLYKCGLCFHKFTSSARLSHHLESHDGTFLQVCKTCGHESLSKEEMIQHFDSAHSYLTYKCNFCNKMCKSVKKLKNHMWSHISKCEICGEKFYNVELLDVHLKEQHGIDPDSIKKEEDDDDKTDDSETDDAEEEEEDMNGDKDSNASTEKAEDSDHGDDHGPDGGGNGGTNSADGANGADAPGNGADGPGDSKSDKNNGINDNKDKDKYGANGADTHGDSNCDNNNGINDTGDKDQEKHDPDSSNTDSIKDEEDMDIDPYSFINRAETMKTPMEIKKEESVNAEESFQNKDTNKSTDMVVHSQPCPSGLEKVSNVHRTECKLLMDSGETDLMSAQTDNVYTVKKVVNVMNPFDGMEKDSKMVRISVEISKETNKPTYSAEYQLSQIKEAIRRAGLLKKTMRTAEVGECFICFQAIPMIDLENHIRGHSVVELSKVKAALDVLGIKINALERSLYMCNLCNVGLESAQALSLHVSKHLTLGNPPTAKTVPVARKRKQSSPKDGPKAKNAKLKPPKNKDVKDVYVSTPTQAKGENAKLSKKETSSSCSVLAAYLNAGPLYQSSALTKALQQHLQAKIKKEASTEQYPIRSEANTTSNADGLGTNTDSIQENAGKSLAESLLQGGKSSCLQTHKVDKGHSVDAKGDNSSKLPEPSATNDDSDQDTDRSEIIDLPGQKTDEDREFRILLKKHKSTKTSVPVSKPWETTSAALSDVKVVQASVSTEMNQSPLSLAPSVMNVLPGNMFTNETIGANPKPPLFLQSAKNVITDSTNPVTSVHVTEPNAIKTGFNQTSPHPIFLISNKNLVKNLNMKQYEMFSASDGTNVPKFVRLLKKENTGVLSVDPKSSQPIKADTFTSITSPVAQGSEINISSPLNVLMTSSSPPVYVPPKFLQGSSSITSTLPASIAHGQNLPVAMNPATVRFISPKQLHSAQQQMTIGKRSVSFDAIRNQNRLHTITFLKQKLSSVAVSNTTTALSSPFIATKDIVAGSVPSMENHVVSTNIADQIGKQTDSPVDSIMRKTPAIKEDLSAPSPILTSTSHNVSSMIRATQAPISTTPSMTNTSQTKNTSHVVSSANQVGPQVHISMTSPSVINTALISPSMINAPQMVISSTQPSSINIAQYTALLNQLPSQVLSTSQPTMITTGKSTDPTTGQTTNTLPPTNVAQQATLLKQPAVMLHHTDPVTGQSTNTLPSTNIAQQATILKQHGKPPAMLNVKLSQMSQTQSVSPLTGQTTNTLPPTNVVQLATILKQPSCMLNHTGRTTGQLTNTLPSTNIAQQATLMKPAATLNVKLPQMSQPQSVSPLTIPIMNSAVTGHPPYVGVSSAPTTVLTEFPKPTFNIVLTQSSTTLPVTSPSIASSIFSQIHGHKIPILKTMGPVMPHETKPKDIGMEGSASIISQTPNPLPNRLALVCTFCKEEIHSLEMITRHVCKGLQAVTTTPTINESKNSEVDTGILPGALVHQSFESSVTDNGKTDTMLVNSEHSAKTETSENLRTEDTKNQENANIADFHRKHRNCSLEQAAVTSFSKKSDDIGIDLNPEVEEIRPVNKNSEINREISKSIDGEAGLKCDDCGLGGFRSTFLLKQHRVIRHLHPVARTSPSYYQHVVENIKRSKYFECGVCRHKVDSKSLYQQHLRVHIKSMRGNYLCSHQDCSLKFKTRLSCLNHIKVCKNGKSKPVRAIEAQDLVNPFPNTACF